MRPPLFPPPLFPGGFPGPEPAHHFFPLPHPGSHDGLPIGAIIAFPGEILQQTEKLTTAMTDLRYMPWMICDGSSLLIAEYPDLYRVIGELYGSDAAGQFKLPDYRGYFLRGVDPDATLDKDQRSPPPGTHVGDRGVGSTQADALRDHEHELQTLPVLDGEGPPNQVAVSWQNIASPLPAQEGPATGPVVGKPGVNVSKAETRPVNIAVNWLIKTR